MGHTQKLMRNFHNHFIPYIVSEKPIFFYPSSTNPFSLNKEVRDLKKVFQLSHPKSESSG